MFVIWTLPRRPLFAVRKSKSNLQNYQLPGVMDNFSSSTLDFPPSDFQLQFLNEYVLCLDKPVCLNKVLLQRLQ